MPRIRRQTRRITIIKRPHLSPPTWDSGLWVVKLNNFETNYHSLQEACQLALKARKTERRPIVGVGKDHISILPKFLVESLAENHPLWWRLDGKKWFLIARTSGKKMRTKILCEYATYEYALELHNTMLEIGANINPDSMNFAHHNHQTDLDARKSKELRV